MFDLPSLVTDRLPSPLVELDDHRWRTAGVRLWVKRDDLLAPAPADPWCGNKWRKLYYNLLDAQARGYTELLTFGGAFSNHLAAVASAGRWLGWRTVGVVRGEPVDNPTLRRARADGMELVFVSRTAFRELKTQFDHWQQQYPAAYILPEGGSNALALQGCAELATEIYTQLGRWPTHLAAACGTGGTLAGLVWGARGACEVLGFAALKGQFLSAQVAQLLATHTGMATWPHWHIHTDYHFGGYARWSPLLLDFMHELHTTHRLPLEPIYTAKLAYGLFDLAQRGYFPAGSEVVMLHSGGLQGWPDPQ